MKHVCVIAVYLLVVVNATAQPANKLSLQQAIETAIRNNTEVRQNDVQSEVAGINYQQAKANRWPNLNAFANHGFNQGRSIDPFSNSYIDQKISYANYGLSSGIVLFNGQSINNNIQQAATAAEASKMELQQSKDIITINVMLAYLQVLSNEELVGAAHNQVQVSQEQLKRLEVLNSQGATSPPLVAELKGQLMNDELQVVNAKNTLELSKLQLLQLMNLSYNKNLQLEIIDASEFASAYPLGNEDVVARALNNLAVVKAAQLRRQSAEAALKAIKGERYPVLSLVANINTNYSSAASQSILVNSAYLPGNDYVVFNGAQVPVYVKQNNYSSKRINYNDQLTNNLFSSVGLNLRIPIVNGSQVKNKIRLASLDIQRTILVEENTRLQLTQAIEQAYLNMTNARERWQLLQQQVQAYADAFRAADIRFRAGVGTSVDYVVAKNNLDRANINLIMAKYDLLLRKKVLDYYAGNRQ